MQISSLYHNYAVQICESNSKWATRMEIFVFFYWNFHLSFSWMFYQKFAVYDNNAITKIN